MKRTFTRSPIKITGYETKGSMFVGVVWPVIGSKGDKYEVEMVEGGFKCTCTGFTMHGKCKHIQGVWDRLGRACYSENRYD